MRINKQQTPEFSSNNLISNDKDKKMIQKSNNQNKENLDGITTGGRDHGSTGLITRPGSGDPAGCATSEEGPIAPFPIRVDPSYLSMWMVEGKEFNEHGTGGRVRYFVLTGWVDALPDTSAALTRLNDGEYHMCWIYRVVQVGSVDSIRRKVTMDRHGMTLGTWMGSVYDGVDDQTGLGLDIETLDLVREFIAGNLLGTEDDPDLVDGQQQANSPG
jgi:hypothetical protein